MRLKVIVCSTLFLMPVYGSEDVGTGAGDGTEAEAVDPGEIESSNGQQGSPQPSPEPIPQPSPQPMPQPSPQPSPQSSPQPSPQPSPQASKKGKHKRKHKKGHKRKATPNGYRDQDRKATPTAYRDQDRNAAPTAYQDHDRRHAHSGHRHHERREAAYDPYRNRWFVLYGDVSFVSNYIYRGFTETFGGPAVQGELVISQKKDEGLFAGMWGSNIDGTTATNGSGLELVLSLGYMYKYNQDLSLKLEIRDTRYPGAYNPAPTKDSYDMWEIIPSVTYKYFTFLVAYQVSNVSGINQNFVQGFFTPIPPNGNTKGSWYTEGSVNYPIQGTCDRLKLKLLIGYWYIRNYSSMLSYANFGVGLSYKVPENYGGLIFSINASATTGKKKYYTSINVSGQSKNIMAPTIWVGVRKEF